MPKDILNVEWVPLGRLHCNPANPRLNDPAVPHVASSIRRFGWQQPIVARPSGEVIAGKGAIESHIQAGHSHRADAGAGSPRGAADR